MTNSSLYRRARAVARLALLAGGLACGSALAAGPQPGFKIPDDAVAPLVAALNKHDPVAVGSVLGPGSQNLVRSGDPVKDHQEAQRFLDAYAARHALVADGPDRMVLHVGVNDWPMPIPIVQRDGMWRFDARQGTDEMVNRRVGRNEIGAIRTCLAYVDAQKAYFQLFQAVTGTGAYAQRLVSTPGDYDGLYWPSASGAPQSPFSPLVESAIEEGYPGDVRAGKPLPYQGYYYRIMTVQGPSAPSGAKSYLQDGKLVGGFALIAWPAIYSASGIMTFIVDQDGIVFQKDLGPTTAARAAATTAFDPSLDWTRVDTSAP